jgi:hypothetical protein
MVDAIAMSHRIANEVFTVKLIAAVDRLTCNLPFPHDVWCIFNFGCLM